MAGRRGLAVFVVAAAVATTFVAPLTSMRPAAADVSELGLTGSSTFTVGDDGSVHVALDQQVTNHKPGFAGGYYYFDTVHEPVVAGATKIVATLDGRPQSVTIEPDNREIARATVHLNPVLTSLQTKHLIVNYDVAQGDPRADTFVQDNAAFVSFPAFAIGDSGAATVNVVVPQTYDVDIAGSSMSRHDDGTNVVYTATGILDPSSWFANVSANDDPEAVVAQRDGGRPSRHRASMAERHRMGDVRRLATATRRTRARTAHR